MKLVVLTVFALASFSAFGATSNPGICSQPEWDAGCQTYYNRHTDAACLCPDPVPPQEPDEHGCHGMSYPSYDPYLHEWHCISMGH